MTNLPEHEPDPNLWSRIEARLQADAPLDRAIGQLPEHEPDANLWDRIEADLNEPKRVLIVRGVVRSLGAGRWLAGAVAAMLVLVGGWLFLTNSGTDAGERVTVAYSIETQPKPTVPTSGTPAVSTKQAEAFINQRCAEERLVCQKPEVHELRSQLVELKQEQARLGKEIALFGDDPALVQAQAKLENQRAEVIRELVTLLRS